METMEDIERYSMNLLRGIKLRLADDEFKTIARHLIYGAVRKPIHDFDVTTFRADEFQPLAFSSPVKKVRHRNVSSNAVSTRNFRRSGAFQELYKATLTRTSLEDFQLSYILQKRSKTTEISKWRSDVEKAMGTTRNHECILLYLQQVFEM
ncbi:hypothetical protein JTB14_027114 [Gonioctena quinquepunctata]|nr:hypothetical protein JTB14_027114 [Gonioctena quinquepunctata]